MSCGLGAIILVFMLVKHNVDNSVLETELLTADLKRLLAQQEELRSQVQATDDQKATVERQIASVSSDIEQVRTALEKLKRQAAVQQSKKSQLEEQIKKIEVPKTPDVVEIPKKGEQEYLIGLRVEGPKIGILVDTSSSMTDQRLIDIIRRKNGSDASKIAGPKWQRTREIVKWLLARVPSTSQVAVIAFNRSATSLGAATWVSGGDANGIGAIVAQLDRVVPTGATNLQAGLEAMAKIGASNLYLVTDGLPTLGDSSYKSLNPFASCSALWGASSTISGECRAKLFRHTVTNARLGGAIVNTILLPVEGDPEAANEFWLWTSATKGLLISPAAGWP
ncbi:MAG: VWA domain-containing protein [Rhodospirillales bacterium]|nr:VWA domain-containing protein [Rhodospirillales bacterium]